MSTQTIFCSNSFSPLFLAWHCGNIDAQLFSNSFEGGYWGLWENLGGYLFSCFITFHDQSFNVFWGGTWDAPLLYLSPLLCNFVFGIWNTFPHVQWISINCLSLPYWDSFSFGELSMKKRPQMSSYKSLLLAAAIFAVLTIAQSRPQDGEK